MMEELNWIPEVDTKDKEKIHKIVGRAEIFCRGVYRIGGKEFIEANIFYVLGKDTTRLFVSSSTSYGDMSNRDIRDCLDSLERQQRIPLRDLDGLPITPDTKTLKLDDIVGYISLTPRIESDEDRFGHETVV